MNIYLAHNTINHYRYWNKNTIISILLFIVYPLASIPLVIRGMLRCEKWSFFLWAVFMGLLGILYPPTGDLYRYTLDYFQIRDISWTDFKIFLLLKQDWLLPYLSYGLGKLGLHFDLSRFIYNFVSYWLLGLIYLDISKSNPAYSKKDALLFLGSFMMFSIGTYTIRFSASSILFAYGAYQIVYRHRRSGWFYAVLSVINHLSFIVFLVALFFCKFRFFNFQRKYIIILVVICFVCDSDFMLKLLSFMPIDIISHYSIYLDGYWAGEYLKDHSFLYRLQTLLVSLISYAAAIIYIMTYKKNQTASIVNAVLLLSALVAPFVTLATRFVGVLLLFIKIQFLTIYRQNARFHRYLVILFCLSIFSNLMGLWGSRRQLNISNMGIILYSSLPKILNYTYSEHWINSNVFDNGDFKHN